jgi:hypothetical protein
MRYNLWKNQAGLPTTTRALQLVENRKGKQPFVGFVTEGVFNMV